MTTKNLHNLMLRGYIRCSFKTSNRHLEVVLIGPIACMLYISLASIYIQCPTSLFLHSSAALECNITRGSLPCFDGTCYQAEQRCDGERQCDDGADELGCKYG